MRPYKNRRIKKRGGFPVVGTIVLSTLIVGLTSVAHITFFKDAYKTITKKNTYMPTYA